MPARQRVTSSSVRVGCSGWQYQHWRGDFYPAKLSASRWFEHYAARFDTVEVNNTFIFLARAPSRRGARTDPLSTPAALAGERRAAAHVAANAAAPAPARDRVSGAEL